MKSKNVWVLLLCMLAGLTVGHFVGELCQQVSFLAFLNYGKVFGLEQPLVVDIGVLLVTLKVQIKMTLIGIVGLIGGILLYRRI